MTGGEAAASELAPPREASPSRPAVRETDRELKGTAWWTTDARGPAVSRRSPTFSHRIGFVGSGRLFRLLGPECHVRPLTRANWRACLGLRAVDLVVIEPCLRDLVGDWRGQLFDAAAPRPDLDALVRLTRAAGVPVIGWMTADVSHLDLQGGFAQLFDAVLCSDPVMADRLASSGHRAQHLPSPIQPETQNPFVHIDDPEVEPPEVLFDGWSSAINAPGLAEGLATLVPLGLRVIESRGSVRRRWIAGHETLGTAMMGCVTPRDRLALFKRARVLVQAAEDIVPRQQAEDVALEAAACRTVVLHRGELAPGDARHGFARAFPSWEELRIFLVRLRLDPLMWEREAQLAWRFVHARYPAADAVCGLLRAAGLDAPTPEPPRATIVTPSYRPANLARVLKQYRAQTWPSKELVVVANTDAPDAWPVDLIDPENREQLVFLPRTYWAGTALNVGAARSTGAYCFRMDDDDHYGPNYVHDLMLHARSCDPDILGKQGTYVVSAETGTVYRRLTRVAPPTVFPTSRFGYGPPGLALAGYTVAVRTSLMRERGYPDHAFAFADSGLFEREATLDGCIALCDPLNAAFERRGDLGSHTWQLDMDWQASNLAPVGSDPEDLLV